MCTYCLALGSRSYRFTVRYHASNVGVEMAHMPHVYLLIRARVAIHISSMSTIPLKMAPAYVHGSAVVIDGSSVYAHSPPTCFLRSNNVTLKPSSRSVLSVDSPHVPVACVSPIPRVPNFLTCDSHTSADNRDSLLAHRRREVAQQHRAS